MGYSVRVIYILKALKPQDGIIKEPVVKKRRHGSRTESWDPLVCSRSRGPKAGKGVRRQCQRGYRLLEARHREGGQGLGAGRQSRPLPVGPEARV